MATMEFLQQEWINNASTSATNDPNIGLQEDGATFTIPQKPVRRRIHGIQTFNVLRGGEYFFTPSLSACDGSATSASPAGYKRGRRTLAPSQPRIRGPHRARGPNPCFS
jgi:hypothetical protein